LDWDRYSYTFVGNSPVAFNNIKVINAVGSEKLAEILKQHDIYLTASKNDPCSNALIEALACGLPAIFLGSGGHEELVGWGGLGFKDQSEIPGLLETVVNHYEMFQNLITVESIDQIAEKYYQVLKIVALAVKKE
jgi:glycosyltransferase involved in cell wall biosynthesis